jgi:hypothetical protein
MTENEVRIGEFIWYNERKRDGQVIQDLLTIERPANPAPRTASELDEGEMHAVVKFFNDISGYGFVTA